MAGDGVEFKMAGIDDMARRLNAFSRDMRVRILRRGITEAARVIQLAAAVRAPVLSRPAKWRTRGLVRESIVIRPSKLARKRGEVGGFVTVKRLGKRAIFNAKIKGVGGARNPRDPFYFRFLEMGTKKMGARPFLGPAVNTRSQEALRAFERVVVPMIERAERRL